MENESYGKFIVCDPEWARKFAQVPESMQNAIANRLAQSLRDSEMKLRKEAEEKAKKL